MRAERLRYHFKNKVISFFVVVVVVVVVVFCLMKSNNVGKCGVYVCVWGCIDVSCPLCRQITPSLAAVVTNYSLVDIITTLSNRDLVSTITDNLHTQLSEDTKTICDVQLKLEAEIKRLKEFKNGTILMFSVCFFS